MIAKLGGAWLGLGGILELFWGNKGCLQLYYHTNLSWGDTLMVEFVHSCDMIILFPMDDPFLDQAPHHPHPHPHNLTPLHPYILTPLHPHILTPHPHILLNIMIQSHINSWWVCNTIKLCTWKGHGPSLQFRVCVCFNLLLQSRVVISMFGYWFFKVGLELQFYSLVLLNLKRVSYWGYSFTWSILVLLYLINRLRQMFILALLLNWNVPY